MGLSKERWMYVLVCLFRDRSDASRGIVGTWVETVTPSTPESRRALYLDARHQMRNDRNMGGHPLGVSDFRWVQSPCDNTADAREWAKTAFQRGINETFGN